MRPGILSSTPQLRQPSFNVNRVASESYTTSPRHHWSQKHSVSKGIVVLIWGITYESAGINFMKKMTMAL